VKSLVVVCLISLALLGCSSTPKILLTKKPIEVESKELINYWVPSQKTTKTASYIKKLPPASGFVFVRFLIDSNGNIFNPKIVDSDPSGAWNKVALNNLQNLHYTESKDNKEKIPVYSTLKFTFSVQ